RYQAEGSDMSVSVSDSKLYAVPEALRAGAHIDRERYETLYRESITDPAGFWARQARDFLSWISPFDDSRVYQADMRQGRVEWFGGGRLNASANCIDRHLPARAEQTAILWEGDEPDLERRVS